MHERERETERQRDRTRKESERERKREGDRKECINEDRDVPSSHKVE